MKNVGSRASRKNRQGDPLTLDSSLADARSGSFYFPLSDECSCTVSACFDQKTYISVHLNWLYPNLRIVIKTATGCMQNFHLPFRARHRRVILRSCVPKFHIQINSLIFFCLRASKNCDRKFLRTASSRKPLKLCGRLKFRPSRERKFNLRLFARECFLLFLDINNHIATYRMTHSS